MGPVSLVTFLRTNQLNRTEIYSSEINQDTTETTQGYFTNPRRSRLIHFHICKSSDEFHFNIDSYVGLLVFSYDNQSKFILNGHHCQRGDIIIKQTKFFNHTHRGMYDNLFKWYFGRIIDEKFFGLGFHYLNGKWRFDLITYDDRELVRYEYQMFDMFILTHWLTQFSPTQNVREMENNAKDFLLQQYDLVKKKLINQDKAEILNNWSEFIGGDANDLQIAIDKFIQMIKNEIENIFLCLGK